MRLNAQYRDIARIAFGLVLTEHRYSVRKRYQIIVPVAPADEFLPMGDDLLITGRGWTDAISAQSEVVLATSDIHSVFHRQQIDAWTGAVVDDETLTEVETRLEKLFEL